MVAELAFLSRLRVHCLRLRLYQCLGPKGKVSSYSDQWSMSNDQWLKNVERSTVSLYAAPSVQFSKGFGFIFIVLHLRSNVLLARPRKWDQRRWGVRFVYNGTWRRENSKDLLCRNELEDTVGVRYVDGRKRQKFCQTLQSAKIGWKLHTSQRYSISALYQFHFRAAWAFAWVC